MKTSIPSMKLGLASAIAVAALAMTGCGGDSDSNDSVAALDTNQAAGVVASSLLNTAIDTKDAAHEAVIPEGAILLDANNLAESAANAFANIKDGDVIVFPAGYYHLPTQLKITGDVFGNSEDGRLHNITIMGSGVNETVLNFSALEKGSKGETKGVDGLLISDVDNLVISDITVVEAGKNAIKVENIDGLHMHHLATIWDGSLTKENGAYGIYPVNSKNILIENTFTRGSADAGVYVGQSQKVIVRNSVAKENVAGMEIENCEDAEFYGNLATGNTAGLLVFDLPIGNGKYGSNVRVYNNEMIANNEPNFAVVSDFAGGVHIAPHGTGMIILSTSDVEIFDNTITDHGSFAVAIADYAFAESPENLAVMPNELVEADLAPQTKYLSVYEDGYSPTVRNITIHGNNINNAGYAPDAEKLADFLYLFDNFVPDTDEGTLPAMIFDGAGQTLTETGIEIPGLGTLPLAPYNVAYTAADYICTYDNTDSTGATVEMGTPYNPFAIQGWVDGDLMPSPAASDPGFTCGQSRPSLAKTVVTIGGATYGCGTDDTTSPGCVAP
jgi:parallel beta-helix repeat protein